jgi:hypothetical protein
MLSFLKWVLGEYKLFVVKMHIDATKSKHVWKNLDFLSDLELVLGWLACAILLMLKVIHTFIKLVKKWDVFI